MDFATYLPTYTHITDDHYGVHQTLSTNGLLMRTDRTSYAARGRENWQTCANPQLPLEALEGRRMQRRLSYGRTPNHVPNVICPGNCTQHGLRVSGRRNALGAILPRRPDPWFSGSCPALAVWSRSNTHTAPNYRVPLLSITHGPCCRADCLTSRTTAQMIACAQRAQRNTTGYYTGYIQKRQPVG